MGEKRHITLLELQRQIKERLDTGFALPIWVVCEISELKRNYSGHCYMELVEKGGDNGVPRAKASAVIWRTTYASLAPYFSSSTGSELQVGMKVLFKVSVTFHELYGMSLQVTDIDPMYTLGDMERERQLTIERLQKEGVYDMNRQQEFPLTPQRLAIVSSRNAAGFQDFYNELSASVYNFDITLFDAFMQGEGAEKSIIDALGRIAGDTDRFDVVVVIRGGGSQSDLSCFNSYRLCSHLAQFPLPIVTGIGHDKDQSVADLVAAASLKTPTAVAGYLIDLMGQFDAYIDKLRGELVQHVVGVLDTQRRVLEQHGFRLSHMSTNLTRSLELRLQQLVSSLTHSTERLLSSRREALLKLDTGLRNSLDKIITAQHIRITTAESLVENRRPERILSLGFSIVRSAGVAVKNSNQLSVGDKLSITLSRGEIKANITDII